jgi:hypothetical protein
MIFFLNRRLKELDFELTKPSTGQKYEYRHAGVISLQLTHRREEQHHTYGKEK